MLSSYFVEIIFIFLLTASFSPLFMILLLICYLLCFGISLVFLLSSYYYSYIVYLLFLSGLLVMFMYVCSIINNEKIYLGFSGFFLVGLTGGVVLLLLMGDFFFVWSGPNFFYYEFYNLIKFFIFSFNIFSGFFVFYLLLCLVVVYEVIKKNKGPLRMGV